MNAEESKQQLIEITQRLNPVLNPLGYVFQMAGSGVSSGGPFAAGFYLNGERQIGLIYRATSGLGSVNYKYDQFTISHDGLMQYLGKLNFSKLKYDPKKWSSYGDNGGNVVDAFLYDIQNYETDFLASSDEQFAKVLREVSKTAKF